MRRQTMKALKWILFIVAGLVVVSIAALLILPRFVDLERYRPHIEKKVTEATGLTCRLEGDLDLALFPSAGLSFSDFHLENPPGFEKRDLLAVASFHMQVKLLPLLSRKIQVKRFILKSPRIALEKSGAGKGNWQWLEQEGVDTPSAEREERGLPFEEIAVGELEVSEASLLWIDHLKGERREITGVNLRLEEASLDRPVDLVLSATLDGIPLSLEGSIGPVGKDPGKGTIPLELMLSATSEFNLKIDGSVTDPATRPQFDLTLAADPFSPRKLTAAMHKAFPAQTEDPDALTSLAFKANLKGDPEKVSLTGGTLDLDESNLTFSATATAFAKPDLSFDASLNEIDLDRYLPSPDGKGAGETKKDTQPDNGLQKPMDYGPLRSLVLNGSIHVDKLKAHGLSVEEVNLEISGSNGEFRLDPFKLHLYGGTLSGKGLLDVRQDVPRTQVSVEAGGIEAGPLLKDIADTERLGGDLTGRVNISTVGHDPEKITRSLNGSGDFLFKDGAIKGMDLAAMAQNVKAAFGLAEKEEGGPRTDFTTFHLPFSVTDGVVHTSDTTLVSPALRVSAAGRIDLVKQTLDMRIEPKFVATLEGQGDTAERSGFAVPVMVTGSLYAPKFRPDLEGMIRKGLEEKLPQAPDLIKGLPGREGKEADPGSLEEKARDLLKDLPFGR
jgi:AsmA protein